MVLDGAQQSISHSHFPELPGYLKAGDRLVFNNTRVVPARMFGKKETGGRVELLLERITGSDTALAKIRASKSPKSGQVIYPVTTSVESDVVEVVLQVTGREGEFFALQAIPSPGGSSNLAQNATGTTTCSMLELFEHYGRMPLPPYIERKAESEDMERYQTIYAQHEGAVAAPTAGLHFTESLLQQLQVTGIDSSFVTLHVGAGTFQPVRVEDLSEHEMHAERYRIDAVTADEINATRAAGGRIIAVGTTSVRTLESAARRSSGDSQSLKLAAVDDETRLFVKPGDPFYIVDGMITNFHLPESTLIMLVAAFAGTELTLAAYRDAVEASYRFYSYGDAMLVWPSASSRVA